MIDDPYRGSHQAGTCPRCGSPIKPDGELGRLVCGAGCGEWYPKLVLDQVFAWHELDKRAGGYGLDGVAVQPTAWPWGAAPCAVCRADMKVGFRAELRFDYCGQHGLWLDRGELARFIETFEIARW